jgi:GxxExxY protein
MDADKRRLESDEISRKIIGCAYTVSNELGSGFLEKVYENALAHDLRKAGLVARQQHGINVMYDGVVVGEYSADILVNDSVIIELKTVKGLDDIHVAQCLNYLRGTGLNLCLLLNFATPRVQVRRVVHEF